jgi:hypothetical protein
MAFHKGGVMKRWIPLLSVVLLMSAAPAFACAYCIFPVSGPECAYDGTIGGWDCKVFPETGWCYEVGECWGLSASAQSFTADWKVVKVTVLTPNQLERPGRTTIAPVTMALKRDARQPQR